LRALPSLLDEHHGEDREDDVDDVKAGAAFHRPQFSLEYRGDGPIFPEGIPERR
jgi:hypothetical protein